MDNDGKFKNSDIVAVKYADKAKFEIFPNPVTGADINIYFNETVKEEVTITVHDMAGREMHKHSYNDPAGKIRIQPNLSPGIYTIRITGKEINASEKIVVNRNR